MRAGFGYQEMRFPWLIFIGLLFLYFFALNPRCWPAEKQVSGLRGQVPAESPDTRHRAPDTFMIYRYQANPYVAPERKLIALTEDRKTKIETRNSPDFRFSIFDFRGSNFGSPAAAGPNNASQVLLAVYDSVNGALKVNGTLAGGSANPTPHNADQVLLASYDSVNGALRINCVTGCGGGGGGGGGSNFQVNGTALASSGTINFQNSAASNGLTLTFSNPSNGNIQLGLSGTLNDAGLTSAYSGVGSCAANTWASTLSRNAAPTCTQPGFANISGTVVASQLPNIFQINGTALASFNPVNFQSSAASNGLTLTFSNPSNGNVQLGLSGNLNFTALGGPLLYHSAQLGMACNDSTDDTSALSSGLSTVNAAGGGTIYLDGMCLINGAVVFPTSSGTGSINQMAPIRITGAGAAVTQDWGANGLTAAPSGLDLRYNAAVAKLETLGTGNLEIDHITLKDGGSDCAPFILTTNTVVNIHDNVFQGTASQLNACNDAVIFGGTGSSAGNVATSMFQGYHSIVSHNFMSQIRRGAVFQSAANNVWFENNSCDVTCGSNQTTAITAATNASPTVLTVTGHGYVVGSTFNINITGATGNWTAINGNFTATVVDANDLSIPVNATSFGSLSGSPVFYMGSYLEFNTPGTQVANGVVVANNLVEMHFYPIFAHVAYGQGLQFDFNGLWDAGNGYNICDYKLEANAANTGNANLPGSQIIDGYRSGGQPEQCGVGGPWTAVRSIWQGIFPNSVTVPTTASNSTGVFKIGASVVLHNYGNANMFGGAGTGNFSLTGTGNTGFGAAVLPVLTSGSNDSGFGDGACNSVTSASSVTCLGTLAGYSVTTNNGSTFGGYKAGYYETGPQNAYFGALVGPATGTGPYTNSFAIGYSITVAASNIGILGNPSVTDVYAGGMGAAAALHAANVTDSALTAGNCVQAGTGGLLATTSSPCGGGSSVTIQTVGTNNSSQSTLNFIASTVNAAGLTVTPSNPSNGNEKFEITGSPLVLLSGLGNPNASTTLTMGAYPLTLSAFNFSSGSIANGLVVTDQTTNASTGAAVSVAPQNGGGSTWNGIEVGQGTQATSSNNYNSTSLIFTGNWWNSSVTNTAHIGLYDVLASGSNPTQDLTMFNCTSTSSPFGCSYGSTGAFGLNLANTSRFQLPTAAGETATATRQIAYDSTNQNVHALIGGNDQVLDGVSATQTLSNKTLSSPVITGTMDASTNNALIKTGACGGLQHLSNDVVSNGSSGTGGDGATETRFGNACAIAAAATATTIDGVHAGVRIAWNGEGWGSNGPDLTSKIKSCPTANVTVGPPLTCSSGEQTFLSSASTNTYNTGSTEETRSTGIDIIPANDGTAGDLLIFLLWGASGGNNGLFSGMGNTTAVAKVSCGSTCSGGAWTVYMSETWSASGSGSAAVCGVTTTGTNAVCVYDLVGQFIGN